jgi:DNA-binding MarR family transcriptional regulator
MKVKLQGCEVLPPLTAAGDSRSAEDTASSRFLVLNSFVDQSMRQLRTSEIAVWLTIYRDTRDGIARTAQSFIAARTGLSLSTVCRAVKTLRAKGLLVRLKQGGKGRGINLYRVLGRRQREAA